MARMRFGRHTALEDEADRILRESMAGITTQSGKSDILTPWKEQDRRSREIYVASGTPDASLRVGMYHRALNPNRPHLNSRDGVSAPSRSGENNRGQSSLADFVAKMIEEDGC